ncbi:MAG: helix-turn-helix transcriptional regulator [Anaeromyxobacteraceae bacterium]
MRSLSRPRSPSASRSRSASPARLSAPRGLVAWRIAGEEDVALLEWPTAAPATPDGLTEAEREVLGLVREGLSNADIARRRGRSVRTVANQIASIFAKCGVRSRAELFALSGGGGARGPGEQG